jgi:hypothetical protein
VANFFLALTRRRHYPDSMSATTIQKTVAAIADRSSGVRWNAESDGLALIRGREGYILVAESHPGDDVLGERLVMPREDGQRMEDGHALTPLEREQAVRNILGL